LEQVYNGPCDSEEMIVGRCESEDVLNVVLVSDPDARGPRVLFPELGSSFVKFKAQEMSSNGAEK
jgi:hypothetical protein